ncbi:putative Cell cycle serine/threonine-protein kinase CDC5/MSD2 [Blattamonas nauphoetae]|uniref:Cell cycle serine/threonine-protein kinase CDC5/MSD2 n=1 Tax=Blattamonas nauphoetae TaxID=2049346 RepID=A0ABQ9Y9B6_9EUKA|nr:putative Cell cycle serine/threonine-protein kinase CDC5/MSD2 [Blattamonas nauphoetae]
MNDRKRKSDAVIVPEVLTDPHSNKKYRVGKQLGRGGFAKVFEFTDLQTFTRLAGKAVAKSIMTKPRQRARFEEEVRIQKLLCHPNLVQCQSSFEDDANVYLIMELCEKKSLFDLVKSNKGLSETQARPLFRQVASAVQYLQKHRILHRDLKLGNIFLTGNNVCKVGDFGLSCQLSSIRDRRKTICGTPNYIAPEIISAKIADDEDETSDYKVENHGHSFPVDVWALGVILFAMINVKPPFESKQPKETYHKIRHAIFSFPKERNWSPEIKDLIKRILVVNPEERLTIDDVLEHEWLTLEESSPSPASQLIPATSPQPFSVPLPPKPPPSGQRGRASANEVNRGRNQSVGVRMDRGRSEERGSFVSMSFGGQDSWMNPNNRVFVQSDINDESDPADPVPFSRSPSLAIGIPPQNKLIDFTDEDDESEEDSSLKREKQKLRQLHLKKERLESIEKEQSPKRVLPRLLKDNEREAERRRLQEENLARIEAQKLQTQKQLEAEEERRAAEAERIQRAEKERRRVEREKRRMEEEKMERKRQELIQEEERQKKRQKEEQRKREKEEREKERKRAELLQIEKDKQDRLRDEKRRKLAEEQEQEQIRLLEEKKRELAIHQAQIAEEEQRAARKREAEEKRRKQEKLAKPGPTHVQSHSTSDQTKRSLPPLPTISPYFFTNLIRILEAALKHHTELKRSTNHSTKLTPPLRIFAWSLNNPFKVLQWFLSDGVIGVLFTDHTTILEEPLTHSQTIVLPVEDIWTFLPLYQEIAPKPFQIHCQTFQTLLQTSVPFQPIIPHNKTPPIVYVHSFKTLELGHLFVLSNNTIQLNINDHSKIVILLPPTQSVRLNQTVCWHCTKEGAEYCMTLDSLVEHLFETTFWKRLQYLYDYLKTNSELKT